MKKRVLVMIAAIAMTLTAFVGGTLAWFTDSEKLEPSVYTVGNVNISVGGSTGTDGILLPGKTVYSYSASDNGPAVTVNAGSVACYVFVKITPEFGNTAGTTSYSILNGSNVIGTVTADDLIDYVIYSDSNDSTTEWTPLAEGSNIYYQAVPASNANVILPIYSSISTPSTVTKAMFDAIGDDKVNLDVEVYAIQTEGIKDVDVAWKIVSTPSTTAETVILDGGDIGTNSADEGEVFAE